jgi:hypothetical protein
MNFGKIYIDYIKSLYKDICSHVANRGSLGESFEPGRGIRQGCPISANLFIIIVEIMASAIRQNPNILGIKIGQKDCKISQYADDTCIYVADTDSLLTVFEILENFSICSGLKVNREKSEAMGIGACSNYRHKQIGIKWPTNPIKCLGIYICNDTNRMRSDNFERATRKCENILQMWNIQNLTLKGKICIVNTLVLPQLLYVSSVMSIPAMQIKAIKDLITKFIWNKKPAKVKYSAMINDIEQGGLKLQDFESKLYSLKLKWIKAMCDNDSKGTWKEFINSHSKQDISQLMTHNKSYSEYNTLGDSFYDDIMKIWAEIHFFNPTRSEDVINQRICNNSLIKIEHSVITEKKWPFANIKIIKDIVNDNGVIASNDFLMNKYNVNIPVMTYNSVISAIPKTWKKAIIEDPNILNYVTFEDYKVTINETRKKIIEFSTKDLYWHNIKKKSERPTSEKTWEDTVGLNFEEEDWAKVYLHAYGLTRNTRILAFHFKLSHRILACKEKLYKWKIKDSDICDRCLVHIDGLEHHLIACPRIRPFWNSLFTWWKSVMLMLLPIDTYDILFGLANPNKDSIITQLNFTTLHGMYYVYNCNRKEETPVLYNFLLELKNSLICIKVGMIGEGKEEKFNKLWGELIDNF